MPCEVGLVIGTVQIVTKEAATCLGWIVYRFRWKQVMKFR